MCLIVCINDFIKNKFKMEIISYIVPQGFFALSQFATFSYAGGSFEPVKPKNCQKTC